MTETQLPAFEDYRKEKIRSALVHYFELFADLKAAAVFDRWIDHTELLLLVQIVDAAERAGLAPVGAATEIMQIILPGFNPNKSINRNR